MKLEMSEAFAEWLSTCPCIWFLIENPEEGEATYVFYEELTLTNENE